MKAHIRYSLAKPQIVRPPDILTSIMPRKSTTSLITQPTDDRYSAILSEVVGLLEAARSHSARAVNAVMTATYWQIGRRIVENEQSGAERAEYGAKLLQRLSTDLTSRFGRGFSVDNLELMRRFYSAYPRSEISETPSRKFPSNKSEIASRISGPDSSGQFIRAKILQTSSETFDVALFPLPWSHYVRLLSIDKPYARQFYETEALRGGWTVKQLDRQIDSQFYERTALSRNKAAMLTKHNRRKPGDLVTAEEQIKDPLVLEFLNLKDEYSETELEEALIRHLESFLLELGTDFAFIGRQKRLRIGDTWYRIDLLFYHRRLRCLVIIDLKTGPFTHADAGQMHLYCKYAREHWTHEDENPPVGLILASRTDDAVAHYALDGLPNKVLAAQYKTELPDEAMLASEMEKTRKLLESRRTALPTKPVAPAKRKKRRPA